MSVAIDGGFTGLVYALDTPRIGWQRITGTILASTSAAGYAAANASTDRTDSFWRPTSIAATWRIDAGAPVPVSYLGIAAHDIGTQGCNVVVQHSSDDSSWTTILTHVPTDDSAILCLFAEVTARYWRVRLTGGAAPTIGHIRFGTVTEFPLKAVYAPAQSFQRAREVSFDPNLTETGQWAGRSKRRAALKPKIEVPDLSVTWVTSVYDAFALAAETETFFLADRPGEDAASCAYCLPLGPLQAERTRAVAAAAHTVVIEATGFMA